MLRIVALVGVGVVAFATVVTIHLDVIADTHVCAALRAIVFIFPSVL
jgi:hypothetical protein